MTPRFFALCLASSALAWPLAAAAQEVVSEDVEILDDAQAIEFAADELLYDNEARIVTASGSVVVTRAGYRLSADKVTYDRDSGVVEAVGNVVIVDPQGNEGYAARVELTDELRDGAVDGFLLVLQGGGRLAARSGTRVDGVSRLDRAVYSPCDIIDSEGCPKEPLWQIKADSVVHDPEAGRISYDDARLELFGVPVFFAPSLSHPDRAGTNASGLLVPDVRIDRSTGVSLELPYLISLSDSSDFTIAPTVYSEVNPSLGLEYRRLTSAGPLQVGGIVTYSSDLEFPSNGFGQPVSEEDVRGYIYGNGQFQHSSAWRSTFGLRYASDDTFLRRYDISRDDTLRNFYRLEQLQADSYFAVESWAFQGLRQTDEQGLTPIVLPLVNYRWTPTRNLIGGRLSLTGSTAVVTRTDGMDSQRGSVAAEWKRSGYTPLGQRVTATALVRGDIYNTNDAELAELGLYAGEEGWEGRILPAAALDVEWPFAGPAFGGTQMITPRVQFSASPTGTNDGIPNEDSRAVDLETINLFDINRFPGYDRWEGGARITYGAKWTLRRPRWLIESELGQSYRLDDHPSIVPPGTGLEENFSDFVGRNTLRIGRRFDLTHRFRVDKESFLVRRNEIDLTIGGARTYATLGYLKLDRDIAIEDLADREEARAGGRLQITRYWSVVGSVIVDLTGRAEDPLSIADGFDPIRHRLGFAYEDECFEFGFTWRRDYVSDRDFERGNTFLVRLALKNLG